MAGRDGGAEVLRVVSGSPVMIRAVEVPATADHPEVVAAVEVAAAVAAAEVAVVEAVGAVVEPIRRVHWRIRLSLSTLAVTCSCV